MDRDSSFRHCIILSPGLRADPSPSRFLFHTLFQSLPCRLSICTFPTPPQPNAVRRSKPRPSNSPMLARQSLTTWMRMWSSTRRTASTSDCTKTLSSKRPPFSASCWTLHDYHLTVERCLPPASRMFFNSPRTRRLSRTSSASTIRRAPNRRLPGQRPPHPRSHAQVQHGVRHREPVLRRCGPTCGPRLR